MKITSDLFAAHLKCPTKCWLRAQGEAGEGNEYANWVRTQNESYRSESAKRLLAGVPENERVVAPLAGENPKTAKWRLAVDLPVQTENLESRLHAVERIPSEGRGKPAQVIPIRFIFTNKLTKDDRRLVAFDALVLSEVLGREVSLGKIIHGDDHATLKVKVSNQFKEVRKRVEKITALLSSQSPPDLVLNRHCAECEFQARCKQKAVEKDDLSLLAGMSGKERKKFNSKGIFTVTQLSYTFRPRRRPKRLRDKREKYHHALKALAIREKKIHIVGTPELKVDGTPVYLDVEGLPDRDFYYLIGLRIGNGESAVQHSLWADTAEDEGKIWREFLAILETVEKPVLIHYGSYETTFLKRMSERHGGLLEGSKLANYQRERVYVRSSKRIQQIARRVGHQHARPARINKNLVCPTGGPCPQCNQHGYRYLAATTKVLHDLSFGKNSVKRSVVKYRYCRCWCPHCHTHFGVPKGFWPGSIYGRTLKYGRNLVSYIVYESIDLCIPQHTVTRQINRLFGYDINQCVITQLKAKAAGFYRDTQQDIVRRIVSGTLIHVDETRANVKGKTGYVWVFTNLHEVAYLYSDSREGEFVQAILADFKGVLISDFHSAYDSLACAQQKCLLHLMRDLNDELLNHPYDEELKLIVRGFAQLLKPMVETIDQRGLKKHFLRKHLKCAERFYKRMERSNLGSEAALKCGERFQKNRGKLFTFLEYDGVPWNNNNAEHAIKAFAALRDVMQGSSTQKGIEDYLVLLSICQTCKYQGLDFLDFLRSGEKDIQAFAESRRRKRKQPALHRSAVTITPSAS